jgi:hypothetical protein
MPNHIVQAVTQKPHVIEPFWDDAHQFALAAHVVQKQQQHHFDDHGWIFGNVALGSIEVRHFFLDEIELEQLIEFAQRMIAAHSYCYRGSSSFWTQARPFQGGCDRPGGVE